MGHFTRAVTVPVLSGPAGMSPRRPAQQRPFVKLQSIVHQGDASQSPLKRAAKFKRDGFRLGFVVVAHPETKRVRFRLSCLLCFTRLKVYSEAAYRDLQRAYDVSEGQRGVMEGKRSAIPGCALQRKGTGSLRGYSCYLILIQSSLVKEVPRQGGVPV